MVKAIEHATRINGWMESLSSDETPPEWMWPFEDRLTVWFKNVEREREEKYGGKGSNSDDDDGLVLHNELAREGR